MLIAPTRTRADRQITVEIIKRKGNKNETFENLTVKQIITIIALVTVDNNIKGKFQANFQ